MKKSLLLGLVLLFAATLTQAQNDRDIKTEDRQVASFSKISVQDGIDLFIRQGNSVDLTVKATAEIIDEIITEVKENTLVVKRKDKNRKNWSWGNRNYKQAVYLTIEDVSQISASGGSDIKTEELALDELTIKSSGGSDIDMELEADELNIYISGGADINLEGSAKEMEVRASGGSDLNARGFKAVNCRVSTSGGSDVNVYASGTISMNASGASDINYSGPAEVTSKKSSGAADIRKN